APQVAKNANRAQRRKAGVRTAPAPVATSAATPSSATKSAQSKVPALAVKGLAEPQSVPLIYSAPSLDGGSGRTARQTPGTRAAGKTATVSGTTTQSRNSLCECGSGKKFKHCHGAPARRSADGE
ncbi:MAG: SEC-C domain-containing protein, partial [Geodermatophilaceae bacterium]|nr:SEC-C domain-containing protein [Geodermatophilaceae bacterium]